MNQVQSAVKTSALAVWSLVLGILGLVCLGFLASIPAIICGHMGRSQIKQSEGTLVGDGLAIAGLILGYVGSVLTTIFLIGMIAAIAIPAFFAYESKANCAVAELQAKNAISAVDCHLAIHETLPTAAQLESNSQCGYQPLEGVTIEINGTMDQYQVTAVDMDGDCLMGDRYTLSMPEQLSDGWQ